MDSNDGLLDSPKRRAPETIELEPSLTYECLSATVPFEDLYSSQERKNHPHQVLVTFPQDYLVIETFHKTFRTKEAAGSDVNIIN